MAPGQLTTSLGDLQLRSPLIAASGTVGSVWEWAEVADVTPYGAAVAKSVAPEAWAGRPPPRLAPTEVGMLNGIGIQNPGIEAWARDMGPRIGALGVPVWGSAVGNDAEGFARVAKTMDAIGVEAIEVNLSCPNLEEGQMFSYSAEASRQVVEAVTSSVGAPVGAKLSPNTPDIVAVSAACRAGGADFVVLTNTSLGFGLDIETGNPLLSGGVGGFSGPGLKPLSLRCVYEVSRAIPDLPIVGCGGVLSGADVLEYLIAGASAVEAGTVHLANPRAGSRIIDELGDLMEHRGMRSVADAVATVGRH